MRDLASEREYAGRCREALRRMVAGARENVAVGAHTWGDRYTAERPRQGRPAGRREPGRESSISASCDSREVPGRAGAAHTFGVRRAVGELAATDRFVGEG
jgi:hypothetical protein